MEIRPNLVEIRLLTPRINHLPNSSPPLNFPAIRGILAVQTNLSDRVFIRVHTGWRREEWAYRPLFICGKLHPETT